MQYMHNMHSYAFWLVHVKLILNLNYMLLQGNSWLFGPCYALLGWYIQVVEKQEQATNKSESSVLPFILQGLWRLRSTTQEIWWCCLWIHKPWWGRSLCLWRHLGAHLWQYQLSLIQSSKYRTALQASSTRWQASPDLWLHASLLWNCPPPYADFVRSACSEVRASPLPLSSPPSPFFQPQLNTWPFKLVCY